MTREDSKGNVLRGFGETNLIGIIKSITGSTEDNDLEFIEIDGNVLAIKIDGISLSTSRMPFMSYFDMGWKVMTAVGSDFLVKLSKPLYAVVSITMRGDSDVNEFRELINGLNEGAKYLGMKYLGGDLNEGLDDIIDVAALGKPLAGVIGRSPRIGDVLVTKPYFGYTGLVFKLYYSNELGRWIDSEIVKEGIEMLRRPRLEINLLNELLRYRECISASMDSSDGLGKVLWTMSVNGGVRITVNELPVSDAFLDSVGEIGNVNVEEVVFNGGEEFLPVFSIRRDCLPEFERLGFKPFAVVEEGNGVYFRGSILRYRGWDYFIGWSST
ncbi:AIR synthase related protein [Vulcanisaeta sp. JCM 16161]|uniref:thiamine-phosphate kinase n=1 Tax=Vulcanisaeta sp. JCM 16161 TaxID=1295372 RepID=UPI0006CFECE7|nr:AIR synthase related protein [Vulcanisaeta sp. JCM 16161]